MSIEYHYEYKQPMKIDTKADKAWYKYRGKWHEITDEMMTEAIRQAIENSWKQFGNPNFKRNVTDWRAIDLKCHPIGSKK